MGFSLGSITKPLKKVAGGALKSLDPLGITGMITSGLGLSGGGDSASAGRKRYQRKIRNKWQSKRQKRTKSKKGSSMLLAGIKKKMGYK